MLLICVALISTEICGGGSVCVGTGCSVTREDDVAVFLLLRL